MLQFEALVGARAAIHAGADAATIRKVLVELDESPELADFLRVLQERRVLSEDQLATIRGQVHSFLFMRSESAYIHVIRALGSLNAEDLAKCRQQQVEENYVDRLGGYLRRAGLLSEQKDSIALLRARGLLDNQDQQALARSRGQEFRDLEATASPSETPQAAVSRIVNPDEAASMLARLNKYIDDETENETESESESEPGASRREDKPESPANEASESPKFEEMSAAWSSVEGQAPFVPEEDEKDSPPEKRDAKSQSNWALRTPAPTPLPNRTPIPGSSSNPQLAIPVAVPLPPPPPPISNVLPRPPLPLLEPPKTAQGEAPAAQSPGAEPDTRAFDPKEMAAALGNPLAGTGLEERFLLVDKLGQGGMGTVYLAKDKENDDRELALKIVRADKVNDDAMARFKREILCNGFLAHDGVIEIFDGGRTDDGAFYMAMEFFRGEPLSARLKREGPLRSRVALHVLEQVLEALQAIHEANIVHRDIKPENFMIAAEAGDTPKIKIMDFGIARILDQEQDFSNQFFRTMEGQLTGSPAYIAPESMSENDIDPRADLYSLGVAAFELCVGQLPFKARSAPEFLQQHLYADPPDPCELGAHRNVTPELGAFILKLMAKLPRERYSSAQEALAALREQVIPSLERPAQARSTMSFDRDALIGDILEAVDAEASAGEKPTTLAGPERDASAAESGEKSSSGWFGRLRKRLLGGG